LGTCLNCGAPLHGRFCSACGQQDRPPDPTLGEMIADAWENFSGWDNRFFRSFRVLLLQPGAITVNVLRGRRATYITPLRMYLVASLTYFLIAAAAPNVRRPDPVDIPGDSDINIDLFNPPQLTAEQRDKLEEDIGRAPSVLQPLFRAVVTDPVGFRHAFLATFPRAVFVLVPVCAGMIGMFFRRRRYPQHLVFALHVQAAVFVVLAIRELANFTQSLLIVGVMEAITLVFLFVYCTRALRRVYGEGRGKTIAKMLAIGFLYALALVVAVAGTIVWTVYL
jgi:Protein of unknown function (DUF3667)